MNKQKCIGIDAQGGDVVGGEPIPQRVANAVRTVAPKHPDYDFILVGDQDEITYHLSDRTTTFPSNITTYQTLTRLSAVRTLTELAKHDQINGFYTCANNKHVTMALMRIQPMDEFRTLFPDERVIPLLAEVPKSPVTGRTSLWYIIDAGSIPLLTRPEQYVLYAEIGTLYAQHVGKLERPKVGLLNMGIEPTKGSPLAQEAHKLLEKSSLDFIGNVEPHVCVYDKEKGLEDIRDVDVVVCDGYPGNTLIKTLPVGATLGNDFLKDDIMNNGNFLDKLLSKYVFRQSRKNRIRARVDPSQYGGAPFPCLKVPVIKNHGTATTDGLRVGIEKLITYIEGDVPGVIRQELVKLNKQYAN